MFEVLSHYWPRIEASTVLREFGLERGRYVLVSAHREENIDSSARLARVVDVLNRLSERGMPVVVSTHPRLAGLISSRRAEINPLVRFEVPMSFTAFVRLEVDAFAVVSDSGTISEEAAILGLRAVNLREAHERPEAMEAAVVPMSGIEPGRVDECVDLVTAQPLSRGIQTPVVGDYNVLDVSGKVVRIIFSYVDYVRRTVWAS